MERPRDFGNINTQDVVIMEDAAGYESPAEANSLASFGRSPRPKTRSLSDSGGTPSKLSPSPLILQTTRRTSKDDSNLREFASPVTPQRPAFLPGRGLALQVPVVPRANTPPPGAYIKPAPLSPKLDHSQIYASPTNILPRRSRGLDFSRAATSLHHSTLAEQSSPDSSPTMGGRAMNIPNRMAGFGGPEQTSSSLWSMMGNQEKMNISGSLGSTQAVDSSSSDNDDDYMDEEMDDAIITTPQMSRTTMGMPPVGAPFGSPAMSSLISFQQRQRQRKPVKKKARGPLGFGYNTTASSISKSPPAGHTSRRESISWQANQLHISSADSEDGTRNSGDGDSQSGDGQRTIVRRVASRRGNLLPKTKNFARIRAALAEETAPADTDVRHEAEVIKQVRDSDVAIEPRIPPASDQALSSTAASSPVLANHDCPEEFNEDDMMGDLASGLSRSFKQQTMKNSKGKNFWESFSESSSMGGARTTPPPPAFLPRGSSSGISEDLAMDSLSVGGPPGIAQTPSAAEISRRINNKRRRDDSDLDPVSFKRRAVSPGLSVHNSPVTQSPMQREAMPWGSRPGSNGGERAGSSAQSDSGSVSNGRGGGGGGKGRIGFQGMVDTNDGIMRMSIE